MKTKKFKRSHGYIISVVLILFFGVVLKLLLDPHYHDYPYEARKTFATAGYIDCNVNPDAKSKSAQKTIDSMNLPWKLKVLRFSDGGAVMQIDTTKPLQNLTDKQIAEFMGKVHALLGQYVNTSEVFYITCSKSEGDNIYKYSWFGYTQKGTRFKVRFGWPLSLDTE